MIIDTQPVFLTKQPNRGRIFNLILEAGRISRQKIAATLGLSLPTVNQYLDHLFDANLICENGRLSSQTVGRKAKALSVNPTARIALGLDITQHHISLVAVDLCGHVLNSVTENFVFSSADASYVRLMERVDSFISSNLLDRGTILGLGVTLPAIITQNGTVVETVKLVDGAVDFYKNLGRYCNLPYRLYNDANAGGFSEIYSRRNINRMIYLSLSHSIGGAIIENNQIIEGNNCRGGEFGHMTLAVDGPICHCGQRGCANGYCSPDILAAHTGDDLQMFFRRFAAGDPECVSMFDVYLDYLAMLIHNIRMSFDCDIVIGGGMGQYINLYIDALREKVRLKDSYDNQNVDYLKCCFYPFDASAVGGALFYVSEFIGSI